MPEGREVIAQLPDGSEWGYASADAAKAVAPEATILRYMDGTLYHDEMPSSPDNDKDNDRDTIEHGPVTSGARQRNGTPVSITHPAEGETRRRANAPGR